MVPRSSPSCIPLVHQARSVMAASTHIHGLFAGNTAVDDQFPAFCRPWQARDYCSLGQTAPYRAPEVGATIRSSALTRDDALALAHAVDCIADATSTREPVDDDAASRGIRAHLSLVYTLLGRAFEHPMPVPYAADPAHYEFGKATAGMLEGLLREGRLRTTPLSSFRIGMG
ncbi:hypothetical protein C8R46DRAFT_1344045 [Mycena filopes]|nr:hypothetical protein C8R46DRAFT_1344045 [Mycena filopes]